MSEQTDKFDEAVDLFIADLPALVDKAEKVPAGLAARWTCWADDLQELMDRIPNLPRFVDWVGEDGTGTMNLDLDHVDTDEIRSRLAVIRAQADAAAGMYGRASLALVRRHDQTLKDFGVERGQGAQS
jgi:hypothetical protein